MSIISKNTLAFCIDVFKLASVNRPSQTAQDEKNQNNRQGDEQIKNVHQSLSRGAMAEDSRKAFSTTSSELSAMPIPASHAGSQPATASGTQTAL